MPKRALVQHRPWLLLAIVAAVAFFFLRDNAIGGVWLILLKGSAVGALAVYAWYRSSGTNHVLLTFVLALGALGDMALELSLIWGGIFFAAGHLVAIVLYMRNRRAHPSGSQRALGMSLVIATPIIAFALSGEPMMAIYAIALGGMAGAAWTSRYPRYRVGLGAVLFVISDLMIFATNDPAIPGGFAWWLVWPVYFVGQFLIATGVVQTIRHELAEEDDI